ncbi:U-box domain-containing protein 8-like [Pyrus x bretschneideri]|uniref:U-box domain-containing protein 8-like n=1 Tax=Pyrus x bretschneideri TaxID=225117 RepID=UPI0020300C94|nr:U-box domain-containing protein 8-like [Pyrus x bretschneideri]
MYSWLSSLLNVSSGRTFDRASIQRWLDAGHRTCPISKLPLLDHPSLIHNHALRSLISTYTLLSPANLQHQYHHHQYVPSPPPATPLPLLAPNPNLDAYLPSFHPRVQARLASPSALPRQAHQVRHRLRRPQVGRLVRDVSLDDDNKMGLVAKGAIARIVEVLQGGSPNSRAVAATMLTSLAVVEVNKGTIGPYPYAIRALVWLLRVGKSREQKTV